MEFTTHLELHSQATRLFETVPYECCLSCRRVNGVVTLSDPAFQRSYRRPHSGRSSLHYNSDGEARQNDFQFELFPLHSPLLRESLLVSFPPLSYMLKSSGSSYLISGPNLKSFVGEVMPSHTHVCVCAHSPLTRSSAVVHHTFVSCAFHVCASGLPSLGEVLLLLLSQPHTTPGCCSPLHSHTHTFHCAATTRRMPTPVFTVPTATVSPVAVHFKPPPRSLAGRADSISTLTRRASRHSQLVMGVTDTETSMLPGVPGSAMCVQRFDDSLSSAIRITYRISLRSSSLQ